MIRFRHGRTIAALAALLACGAGAQAQKTGLTGAQKADAILNAVMDRLAEAADAHWHKGEYNHIVNLSRMRLAADPANVELYSDAGWLLWSMKRDNEAVALYQQGLKANPDTYFMYDELGMYYMEHKKQYPEAVKYYEKAVACKDCPPPTLHMLAHAYEKNGQLDKALDVWKRAIALPDNPNLGAAKRNLERVQQLLQQQGSPKS
jgi:tetratricopeptide (TPR) repeat protein